MYLFISRHIHNVLSLMSYHFFASATLHRHRTLESRNYFETAAASFLHMHCFQDEYNLTHHKTLNFVSHDIKSPNPHPSNFLGELYTFASLLIRARSTVAI